MHTLSWIAWVAMVMTVALTATNPLYLAVLLLCVVLVGVLAPATGAAPAGFRAIAALGAGLVLLSLLIATINGSPGTHVVVTVPGPRFPSWMGGLRLGGPVTGEGLVAALVRGEAIFCVLLAFAVFNRAVSPQRALHTAPAALFNAGLVVTIGLALLPASLEDLRRIREVQALRGERTGMRQLPALVVPAVVNGLERALRLAEAMEARGYGAAPPLALRARLLGALAPVLLLGAAWGWLYSPGARPAAAAAAFAGTVLAASWMRAAARARHATRLEREPLGAVDRAVIAGALALAAAVLVLAGLGRSPLGYDPFAGLPWPPFGAAGAALVLASAWPVALLARAAPAASTAVTRAEAGAAP